MEGPFKKISIQTAASAEEKAEKPK